MASTSSAVKALSCGATALALALTAAAVGCGDGRAFPTPGASPTGSATSDANLACGAALAEAATAAPAARAGILLRGCPACGSSFAPLVAAADGDLDANAVIAATTACQPACPRSALAAWRAGVIDAVPGTPTSRPWRALAERCQAPWTLADAHQRFASAPLFALTAIAARHGAQLAAPLAIPLPPLTATATALIAPPGAALARLPWRAIAVFDRHVMVGRLAVAIVDRTGLRIDAPGPGYPGADAPDPLAALAALPPPPVADDERSDDPLVIAPRAMAAQRVLGVMSNLLAGLRGDDLRLAVALSPALATWRGAVAPHPLPWRGAAGPRLRLDLARSRVAAVAADGAVGPVVAAPPDLATLWPLARGRGLEVVADVPAELDVAALVALADAAHAAGVTYLATTEAALVGEAAPFDAALLAAPPAP
ncbi:MAG: hypothetical protein KBG48_25660 [Kofleriaceae bacterium]|nr:hypothetical protein [Kofleriaceae bacterium]MBP9170810.1 hypothetical protein [Kofleriaceae bacterium]MBP9857675.1 hypothetical protein [Kofleriaceae bacterium]